MDICVLTGASSGLGEEILRTLQNNITVDEVWIISRNENKLNELKSKHDFNIKVLAYDLTIEDNIIKYRDLLDEIKPNIKYLFNVSGYGKFGDFAKLDLSIWENMINLNIKSLVDMTYYSLKYMEKGSHILNVSSMASFVPLPYLSVYSASKSFVKSFTLAINKELKPRGIKACALCPLWTKTNFINVAKEQDDKTITNFGKMYEKEYVIKVMWKKMKKNKDLIVPGKYAKLLSICFKFLPHNLVMKIWIKSQHKK